MNILPPSTLLDARPSPHTVIHIPMPAPVCPSSIPAAIGDFSASRVNTGATYTPSTISLTSTATDPYSDTYVAYSGFPGYPLDAKTGYPVNSSSSQVLRRLAVGFRTGDHTGSSVPVTAEGPGAFLFTGYMDQSDIFFKMATAATGDTADGDKFVDSVLTNNRYPKTFGK